MKRIITISVFALIFSVQFCLAQKMDNFFYNKGVKDLAEAAHLTNDYISGTYTIQDDYVDITFKSKDHLFDRNINTSLRLVKGSGMLIFSDILVESDNDIVNPFEAFGLQTSMMVSLIKAIDKGSFLKIQQQIIDRFHTDVEKWDGRMWAILGLNLEYIEYAVKN